MPNYVYVAAQDDNQIAVFTIDGETGRLTRTAEIPMPGGPSLLAIRPNRQCLYVANRAITSFPLVRNESTVPGRHHFGEQLGHVEAKCGLQCVRTKR